MHFFQILIAVYFFFKMFFSINAENKILFHFFVHHPFILYLNKIIKNFSLFFSTIYLFNVRKISDAFGNIFVFKLENSMLEFITMIEYSIDLNESQNFPMISQFDVSIFLVPKIIFQHISIPFR